MPKSISKHAHNYILIKGTFQYLNNFIYIPWIFRIPNLIKPKQIVSTFVFILHFSVISPDTFCPMIEFIVFPCTWIGKSKKIVLVTAYWRTEPSGLQNGRSQYNFWVQDSVSYDFFIKVGDGKFRKIVFCFSNIICILLLFCFVSVSAVLHCISHYPALSAKSYTPMNVVWANGHQGMVIRSKKDGILCGAVILSIAGFATWLGVDYEWRGILIMVVFIRCICSV